MGTSKTYVTLGAIVTAIVVAGVAAVHIPYQAFAITNEQINVQKVGECKNESIDSVFELEPDDNSIADLC